MAPFYGWGSTASRLEPLRGGSLLFTTKMITIDLSKQQELDADPKAIQQIKFTSNIDRGGNTTMFY